jgi:hypothetical protein
MQLSNATPIPFGSAVETINADTAKAWLRTSRGNRNISDLTIGKYMADMKEGRWMLNGEAIKFDWNGCLIDGHHRLAAVAKLGTTIMSAVMRGLDPRAQVTMDQGRLRSAACHLSIVHKVTSANEKAALARQIMATENNHSRGNRLSSLEVQDYVVTNNEMLDSAVRFGVRARDKIRGNRTVFGAAYYQIMRVDRENGDSFFEKLLTGIGLEEGNPILAARNSILSDRRAGGFQARQIETILRAFQFWRAGESRKQIRLSGEYPKLV